MMQEVKEINLLHTSCTSCNVMPKQSKTYAETPRYA
jgi:hypothetical protein